MSSSPSYVISIVDYKRPFNVDIGSITEYFSSVLASDGNLNRGALKNGNLLFNDHFIHNITIVRDYAKRTISAKCRAQMKKSTTYQLNMTININRPADILNATCECVAGKGERAACKHLAALCFALLDYDNKKLYESCTQRLQEWHQPTRKSSKPVNLLDINFTRMNHDKNEDEKPKYLQFLTSDIYIPEASTVLSRLLIKYDQRALGAVNLLLPKQAAVTRIPLPSRIIAQTSSPVVLPDLALNIFKYYMDHIDILCNEIDALEKHTQGQASCADWHEARRKRISSTNVHSIVTRTHDFEKLAQSMLQQHHNKLHSNLAVRHGILNEEACRRRYVVERSKDNVCSTTFPCGLVVDPTAPYLCCSPDAIVMEKINDEVSFGILECKCVYADPGATWDDVIFTRENFCLDRHAGHLRLRADHPYYYQLITLLGILDLPWIDICVMKNEDIFIQRLINDYYVWSN
ncbi:unnamed protein product, partial [Adineta ricciae]